MGNATKGYQCESCKKYKDGKGLRYRILSRAKLCAPCYEFWRVHNYFKKF